MTIQMIALDKLGRSPLNVRTIDLKKGIKELVDSIERDGLLQNLTVVPSNKGFEYEVVAGGRRLAALDLLAKEGKIPKDYEVLCQIVDGSAAEAVSLAENQLREQMHPVDQLQAFTARIDKGDSIADVAHRFGVTEAFVKQRMKLASVSQVLLDACRNGELTLEKLQAFSVSNDYEKQEKIWAEVKDNHYTDAEDIKHLLLNGTTDASSPLLKFVTKSAYKKAGGEILLADLFAEKDDASEVVSDPVLLEEVAKAKIEKLAAKLKKDEGLAFVETHLGYFNSHIAPDITEATTIRRDPTPDVQKTIDELETEHAQLEEQADKAWDADDDELHDQLRDQQTAIEEKLDAIEESLAEPHPDELEHVGAVMYLDGLGRVQITRNRIHKGNKAKPGKPKSSGSSAVAEEAPEPVGKYSEKLVRQLTGHKTAILRSQIAGSGERALSVLITHMIMDQYGNELQAHDQCLTMSKDWRACRANQLEEAAPDVEEGLAMSQVRGMERDLILDPIREALDARKDTPATIVILEHVHGLLLQERLDLLSVLVANMTDLVVGHAEAKGKSAAIEHWFMADQQTANYWQPDREGFLNFISKAQIIDTVTQACGEEAAKPLASMKKAEAAKAAEDLLEGTGWLPEPLKVTEVGDA